MANNENVNKVSYNNSVLIDLTEDTITPEVVVSGYTAHDRSGALISGTFVPVTGVKGSSESSYRTGNVNLTPADIGALPSNTSIPSKTSDLENDSGFLTSHQDISGKKNTQSTVSDPTASGTSLSFIDSITQNAQGVITPTKKTVAEATTSASGLMSSSDKSKLNGIASGAQVNSITGIKGDAESTYRTGNVNLTPANIGAIAASAKGAASGVAELDSNGKVPSSQLPSYVDDVLEYAKSSSFPTTGEAGKIYIAQDTNKTYRWSGTAYVEISASLALGTTSSTAYRGDYGNAAYTHAVTNKGSAFSSGLYKITTNSEGHVTAATAVAKSDITGLGIPGENTTYTFDGTYNASTNKAATVSTVTNAIAALDGNLNDTTPGAGKTLTAFSEADGKVNATFGNISITKSQVSDLGTIGVAAAKGVDTSIAASSTSTNLPTSQAVAAFVEGKGYKTTDNNTTYSLTQDSSDGHKITLTPSSGTAQTITIPDNNTDTKVTAVGNHYTPAEDTSAKLSVDASSSTAATWNSTSLVTGVDIKRDAKGHVVGVAVDSIKMPANPNSDTHRVIQVNGTQALGNNTTALNLKAGSNVTITDGGSGAITIAATDTNTWRGIQDNLTSSSNTTESLSAKQGYLLANGSARDNTKVEKTTYEYNKEISFGSSGLLLIGKFPCYDSNVTIEIKSTTNQTYYAVAILATQNINTTGGGTISWCTYGDTTNSVTANLYAKYVSGSRNIEIYFVPTGWSKNLIHIQAVALSSAPTNICESVTSKPAEATRQPTNTATNADYLISGTLSTDRLATSGATAGSYGDSSAQTPGYGSTFKVPYITVDNKGRVTSISDHTVKIPTSDNTWRPVSDSVSSTSSSDAASSKAVKTAYDLAASKTANTGTVTSVATGVGLTGGAITGSGTLKAKLRSETALTIDSAAATTTSGRVYPVAVDKTGYLAVNVPWTSYSNATASAAGLMSAADKIKSDSIEIATLSEVKSYLGIS